MSFWREIIVVLVVVTVASAIIGKLLELAVLQVYPSIDPVELYGRVSPLRHGQLPTLL